MGVRRKATFYVDEKVHKALRLKAAEGDISPSDLLNHVLSEDLKEYLEDIEDITDAKARVKYKRGAVTLEQMKKKIGVNE